MAVFAFKDQSKSYSSRHLDVWGKDHKYRKPFVRMVQNVLSAILECDPGARLGRNQFLKVCAEYFIALRSAMSRFRDPNFYPQQVGSTFALQSFEEWVDSNFRGMEQYVQMLGMQPESEKETIAVEEEVPDVKFERSSVAGTERVVW